MSAPRLVTFAGPLDQQMDALWAQQSREWPMLARGADGLRQARWRELAFRGSTLLVQCNPARMVSTGARIDAASLAARPCFLCTANRPAEQTALAFRRRWLILCNPVPIFEPHYVISLMDHEPQRLLPALGTMLELSQELAGAYTVFYNGPKCGASAPDHLHLQAVRAGSMPFERELQAELEARPSTEDRWITWLRQDPVRIGVSRAHRRPAVVLIGRESAGLIDAVTRLLDTLGDIHPASPEPMLNLLATWCEDGWRLCVFPRSAHRPACYGSGPGQYVISPGAIDMGGILIAPRTGDFETLSAEAAGGILEEVLLSPRAYARLAELL